MPISRLMWYLTIIDNERRDESIFSVKVIHGEHVVDSQSGFGLERHRVVTSVDNHGTNSQLDTLPIPTLQVIHLHD